MQQSFIFQAYPKVIFSHVSDKTMYESCPFRGHFARCPPMDGGTIVPPSDFQSDGTKPPLDTAFLAIFLPAGAHAHAQESKKL